MTADFIGRAQAAAHGPPSQKAKPARSDDARAKDVTRKTIPGSLKGGLRADSMVNSSKSKPNPGSSAGLKNETKATLAMNGGRFSHAPKKNQSKISLQKSTPRNSVGQMSGPKPLVTDHTLKGKSASSNSIGALEKRTRLNRAI